MNRSLTVAAMILFAFAGCSGSSPTPQPTASPVQVNQSSTQYRPIIFRNVDFIPTGKNCWKRVTSWVAIDYADYYERTHYVLDKSYPTANEAIAAYIARQDRGAK